MENLGKIIIVKNLCFKTYNNEKRYTADHSFDTGRPAIIFAEDDEYMYFLTVTSSNDKGYENLFPLKSNCFSKKSYVNVRDIYRKKIFGIEEYGCINNWWEMKEILEYLYYYQTHKLKDEYFDIVCPIIEQELIDLPIADNIKKR